MLESTQNGNHTTLAQDSTTTTTAQSPTQVVPTWLTAASAVAHTVRITHIPDHTDIAPARAPDTSVDDNDNDQPLSDSGCTAELASAYYDAAAMAPLNPFSKVR